MNDIRLVLRSLAKVIVCRMWGVKIISYYVIENHFAEGSLDGWISKTAVRKSGIG